MTTEVTVLPLAPERIAELLPLARELADDMTIEKLEEYVARLTRRNDGDGPSGGVVVAQSTNGYIRGMLGYRVVYDLSLGATLVVENLIVPGTFHGPFATALIDALDGLASDHGCAVIEARLPPNEPRTVGLAREKGFGFDGWRLFKILT